MDDLVSSTYTEDYFLERCGGVEFFNRFGADVLKPMMQVAVNKADLKPGMKSLDVGCGRGELTAHLQARGHDIIGIDGSKDAIKVAKTRFPKASFQHGDLFDLKLSPSSFDRIFFLGIIEHLSNQEIAEFFNEFSRLLKPGGRVIITTCTNSLYHKKLTFLWRQKLARLLHLKMPAPPRSEEDELMHVNEQNYYSLPKHAQNWDASVEPRFNPKLEIDEIYGKNLPANIPVRRAPLWRKLFFKTVAFIPGLKIVLSRANVMVLTKTGV